jgi:GNAT superfamily N-acetyltransferase
MTLLADAPLARRLERTEAHANAAFVEARASLTPALGAQWIDVEGTWAMFDGVGSPLTQTFGLGLFSTPTDAQLDALQAFFAARGADVFHEVSLMADPVVLSLLAARGYQAVEWSTVLVQAVRAPVGEPLATAISIRVTSTDEADHWADIAAGGWGEHAEVADFVRALGRVNARAQGTVCFVAEANGEAIATGGLHIHEGVALMAGASTLPLARNRGAQRALLNARLAYAHAAGCDLAMMAAAPGSSSQKNAQRAGFAVAYSRVKWMKSGGS